MITRIEISGFKSFWEFQMDFAPFTVVAGLNASGKSNLFDALRLLSNFSASTTHHLLITRPLLLETKIAVN